MSERQPDSVELVRRVHTGDDDALTDLIRRHQPWVEQFVRRRLSPALRRRGDTMDFVQGALMRALRYGPRFVTADEGEFRALLGKIVENQLRDEFDHVTAQIRDYKREVRGATEFVVNLEADFGTPSVVASADEEAERLQVMMELLSHRDRTTLRLRQEFGMPFPKIAEVLGVGEDGARKRHDRALAKLRTMLDDVAAGKLTEVLHQSLSRPVRRRIERALRALEQTAIHKIADDAAGDQTVVRHVDLSEAIDRARRAFRAVPVDMDEAVYLERIVSAIDTAQQQAQNLPAAPFESIAEAIAELRAERGN